MYRPPKIDWKILKFQIVEMVGCVIFQFLFAKTKDIKEAIGAQFIAKNGITIYVENPKLSVVQYDAHGNITTLNISNGSLLGIVPTNTEDRQISRLIGALGELEHFTKDFLYKKSKTIIEEVEVS